MASVYNSLLDAVVSAAQGLGLSVGGAAVTVRKQKVPTAEEGLDVASLPLLCVVPSPRPVSSGPFATAGASGQPAQLTEYLAGLTMIAQGNRDPQAGLPSELDWRQALARRFGRAKPVAVPELLTTRVEPDVPVDARSFKEGYDVSAMALRFSCVEPAA